MSVLKIAETVEQKIHDILSGAFDLPKSIIYSVKPNILNEYEVVQRHQGGDVYDLLSDDYTLEVAQNNEYIAVLTCGWAAPVVSGGGQSELAPSQHPERRRVRLMVLAHREGVASVLRFSDNPTETVLDDGDARGSLADAVKNLFSE